MLVRLPGVFLDDHLDRFDTAVHIAGRSRNGQVEVWATDEQLRAILGDAKFYADPACMDAKSGCPQSVINSARRTVATIEKALR